MTSMKIENYTGVADTFTFPNNPITFDDVVSSNHQVTRRIYQRHHTLISGGGVDPIPIILVGHFNGSSRFTDYRNLSKHFVQTTRLKKLFFESDKFYLGTGRQIKKTHSGTRTMFIDYVGSFETIIGLLFSDTKSTSGTNGGNVATFIIEITGTVTDGSNPIVITDAFGNQITIPASSLTTGQAFLYSLVQMVDSGKGIFVSEYAFVGLGVDSGTTTSTSTDKLVQTGQDFISTVTIGDIVRNTTDGTETRVTAIDSNTILSLADDIMASGEDFIIYSQTKTSGTTGGFGIIQLAAGANITTVITINITSAVKTFRDGYSD